MKRRVVIRFGVIVLCLGLLIGFANAAEKYVTLEMSSFLPVTDKLSLAFEQWCKDVQEKTGGRVKVNYHPGGTLTPAAQTFDSIINEIIDVGQGPTGATPGRFPLMEIMDLPLGLKSSNMATRLSNEVYKKFKPAEMSKVKFLFMLSSPPAMIQTKKPIDNLEELKGLKIRCLGSTIIRVMEGLGAVPVVISPGDTYDALQKGVVDGAIVIYDALETLKWGDILKYTTASIRTSLVNNGYVVMNKSRFDSFPADIQQIIDQLSEEYADKMSKLWDDKERNSIVTLAAKGHTTITLSDTEQAKWEAAIQPVYDTFIKERSAKRLPAAEALQFCREWVKANTQ